MGKPVLVNGPVSAQYCLGEELDDGKVFVATDKETGEDRAVRKVRLGRKSDRDHISKMVKQLLGPKHTNIVKYQGAFMNPKELCLAMTLCNCSLMSVVPLPHKQLLFTCKEVANGLNYLHSKGLVHGAVRVSNVLLDKEGRAKLADWGLHTVLGKDVVRQWDAPEIRAGGEVTRNSDVWSYGVLIVECVLGKLPYQSYRMVSPLSLLDHHVTDDCYSLARECLAINKENRPGIERLSRHRYLQGIKVEREVGKQMIVGEKMFKKKEVTSCERERLECYRCGELTEYSPVFMSVEGTTPFQCDNCLEVEGGHMDCEEKMCLVCENMGRVLRKRWERQNNLDKLLHIKTKELYPKSKMKKRKKTDEKLFKKKEENIMFDSLISSVKLMQSMMMRHEGPEVKDGFERICDVCNKLRICLKVQGQQRYCCMTCMTKNTDKSMVCSMCSSEVQFQSGKVSVNGDYFCQPCVEQLAKQVV